MALTRVVAVALATIIAGCSTRSYESVPRVQADPLTGVWEQAGSSDGPQQRFVFRPGGIALWIITADAKSDTFALTYRLDTDVQPAWLDLYGFDRGQLQGSTLFCIADVADDTRFRMDCQPGADGSVRPKGFTGHVMTYRRLE